MYNIQYNYIQKLKIVFQNVCTEPNKRFRNNILFLKHIFINDNNKYQCTYIVHKQTFNLIYEIVV